MSLHDHSNHQHHASRGIQTWHVGAVCAAGLAVIAGALLFTQHREHVLGALLWLPILACPLMHFFMHGHGGHGSHAQGGDRTTQGSAP